MKVYLSADPEQNFPLKILQFPLVEGIRCNTGAPISKSRVEILEDFRDRMHNITPWIDLKCRELRIIKEAILPNDYLELNHDIEVDTPTALYYNEGKNFVIIDEIIERTKLKIKVPKDSMGDEINFGKGASVNIPDKSLQIKGYMTENDKLYVEAAKSLGMHDYLLSFVESTEDINELIELDPEANILAKIESKKGLEFVKKDYQKVKDKVRLVAARADLYMELERPHEILNALKLIIQNDENAIAASLIMESFLDYDSIPRCADFTDIGFLLEIGYQTFLLGDDTCQDEPALLSTLGVLNEL